MWKNRLAPSGIIPILVRFLLCAFERPLDLTCSAAEQYCDGLRGAFIVDDPNDPHKPLYDVDDGVYIDTFKDQES
jgi:hypothetical protein